jgi:hypothetical protein
MNVPGIWKQDVREWMRKTKEMKTICTKLELRKLPIGNTFDCYWAFIELIDVKAFNKFQFAFVVKIYTESLVPQNEPPMLNIIGGLQNLRGNPINVT